LPDLASKGLLQGSWFGTPTGIMFSFTRGELGSTMASKVVKSGYFPCFR